jgi:hypothetical protein
MSGDGKVLKQFERAAQRIVSGSLFAGKAREKGREVPLG